MRRFSFVFLIAIYIQLIPHVASADCFRLIYGYDANYVGHCDNICSCPRLQSFYFPQDNVAVAGNFQFSKGNSVNSGSPSCTQFGNCNIEQGPNCNLLTDTTFNDVGRNVQIDTIHNLADGSITLVLSEMTLYPSDASTVIKFKNASRHQGGFLGSYLPIHRVDDGYFNVVNNVLYGGVVQDWGQMELIPYGPTCP